MKKRSLLFIMLLGAFTFQACNNAETKTDSVETAQETNENNSTVKEDDSEFMTKAASGGMMEVQLGQMAQQKAVNKSVKDFGAMMVADHTKANDELKALAANKNIALPTSLGEDHQKHVSEMQELTGADFDKHYMSMMVNDHEKDIKLFEDAANDGKDADVKALASKTLPVLRTHLEKAKQVNDGMKK